jgi:hypothetical protein
MVPVRTFFESPTGVYFMDALMPLWDAGNLLVATTRNFVQAVKLAQASGNFSTINASNNTDTLFIVRGCDFHVLLSLFRDV